MSALRCMMACLSTDKAITLFLETGVSSTGTREFVIRFLFVIKFFLVPFWSWFVFYHVCFGKQSFGLCSSALLPVCVYASVVVCNPSKIAEVFRSRVRTRIYPARLCFQFWYLQSACDIRLFGFWCLCLRSSPSSSSLQLWTFVWRCLQQYIWG